MSCDTIIFDADHTLYTVDTRDAYTDQFDILADATGVDVERLRVVWAAHVEAVKEVQDPDIRRREAVLRSAFDELDVEVSDDVIVESLEVFWEQVCDDLVVPEGLPDMLQELAADHTLAVASDEFPDPLRRKLETVVGAPENLFTVVVTPEEVGRMKPDAGYVQTVLNTTGTTAATARMVGDSWYRDLAPAAELGVDTVLVGETDDRATHSIDVITDLQQVL